MKTKNASRKQQEATLIRVYRGTQLVEECCLWQETDGYLMSEAAVDGYRRLVEDGYQFQDAWEIGVSQSSIALATEFAFWGGQRHYCDAHTEFGIELVRLFKGRRPVISWSTELEVARHFAGKHGQVFMALVPASAILNCHWGQGVEAEVLLANGVWAEPA